MDVDLLIGLRVMHKRTRARGIIRSITGGAIRISFYDGIKTYPFPAAFADCLVLEDEMLQEELENASNDADFNLFKRTYISAVNSEITYLKRTGGKKYRIIDGERIPNEKNLYIYIFDTDSELHFPDGTLIRIWIEDQKIPATVLSCEEFTITIQLTEYLGEKVEIIEFTAEPWQLLEGLNERIVELDPALNPIAYELACRGQSQIERRKAIETGQNTALKKALSQSITFIWGPPGTGKTSTLANIALEEIDKGNRVLMLSYSNVSVDGALLRVAERSEQRQGNIIRYGYPRTKKLLEKDGLTSYGFVLRTNPELDAEYHELLKKKRKLSKKDEQRVDINKRLNKIRLSLQEKEKELIQRAAFVATTVSKAIVDKSIYSQHFDTVIFDEASMAYVPQVIFSASLAKKHFCCLGDFRQLPAIVQERENTVLMRDIFDYTGITSAVENGYGHRWLVMLNMQYRMHKTIADIASRYMYEDMLRSADTIYESRQKIADIDPMGSEPVCMIDISSTYSVCVKTMDQSRINLLSALICLRLAELMVDYYEVGIITPYSAQSRLIMAMLRDLQERDSRYKSVSCATVHQFQGSEKPVIIYDVVDCFRMAFPGSLLTSKKNDTADRLFNVALTRSQGKFILVANKEYLTRKKISRDLMFTKVFNQIVKDKLSVYGESMYSELGTIEGQKADVFLGDRDEVDSWERYIADIEESKEQINIDIPGVMDDDVDAVRDLSSTIVKAADRGVRISVRYDSNITIPKEIAVFGYREDYVTTPFTVIDNSIIWFGEPLSSADFISEGEAVMTRYFPCLRFSGRYTAKMLKAIFEISGQKKEMIEDEA